MNVFWQSTSTMFVSIVNTIEQSSMERSHPSTFKLIKKRKTSIGQGIQEWTKWLYSTIFTWFILEYLEPYIRLSNTRVLARKKTFTAFSSIWRICHLSPIVNIVTSCEAHNIVPLFLAYSFVINTFSQLFRTFISSFNI